jgi:WhiB family transcriptional regulator, redox-sensing transcriptional regulator
VQELMAASDIVINERVDIEVRTAGVTDLVIQRTVDPTTPAEPVAAAEPTPAVIGGTIDLDGLDEVDDDEDGLEEGTAPVDLVLLETDGLPPELAWQERALCAQTDPEAFFPEKGGSTREAKRVCMSCEVRAECLDYALAKDERFGIWGGLSERERRRVKKQAV